MLHAANPATLRNTAALVGQISIILAASAALTIWAVVVVPRLETRLSGDAFLAICMAPAQ
jgi:hypothetical protein